MKLHLLLLFSLLSFSTFAQSFPSNNLSSFAQLYGYIRYFHPSDEAAAVDWDKFLYHGIEQVNDIEKGNDLQNTLTNLFSPIAPTLQIYRVRKAPSKMNVPTKTDNSVLVTWQHKGFQHSERNVYRSVRLGRIDPSTEPAHGLSIYPDLSNLSGKQFRLSTKGKALSSTNTQIQLLTYTRARKTNRYKLPINSNDWETFQLVDTFEEGTLQGYLTIQMLGLGTAELDDIKVELKEGDEWQEVPIENASFEGTKADGTPKYWEVDGSGYEYTTKENALHIQSIEGHQVGALFAHYAKADESFTAEIGNGLAVRLPLALYLPKDTPTTFSTAYQALTKKLDAVTLETKSAKSMSTRLGAVITAWNILRHSYPYFDVIDTDWDEMLDLTLNRMLATQNEEEAIKVLQKMMATLQDGHAYASHPIMSKLATAPILLDYVENKIVVLDSQEDQLKAGDIILAIDGEYALDVLDEQAQLNSGTLQWRRHNALRTLTLGDKEEDVTLQVKRADEDLTLDVTRKGRARRSTRPDSIVHLAADDIFYINLDAVRLPAIESRINEIAKAKGVIFDLRGYPRGNHEVISYFIDRPVQSARWNIPQIIYPNMENTPAYDTSGRWTIEPKSPQLEGEIVFITGGGAISYAESFMGIIEHYELAEIVGSTTAGANGNVNPFTTMGGFRFGWTGMKVLKQDGSQHHLIGIQPTVPMTPTIEGIRAGRDELLEKAVGLIRGE
ncbi:MAG: S41 family peptidase [Bacteroidota bacterium]